jgi:MFS family permease
MDRARRIDWRTIAFLNAVSLMSQIGQFGIGFVVLPLWITQHGLNAAQLGIFASTEWLGMLAGLAVAPGLNRKYGYRMVIAFGLLGSMIGFVVIPITNWPFWLPAAALVGLGMGLRWIGLEPWLYRIAPGNARGRLVGFHETLIGLAPIVAPILTKWSGITGNTTILLGIAFTGSALLPLAFARPENEATTEPHFRLSQGSSPVHRKILALGVAVGVVAGITEAAFSGLFPIFGLGRNLSIDQMATLLAVFGMGGLLLQYLAGWLADHRGLAFATLICTTCTILFTVIAAMPLGFTGLAITVFALGGTITAYLTLSIIAATKAGDGDLSVNIRRVSMAYTASAIFGPLIAGTAMKALGSEALLWQVGLLAAVLIVYILLFTRPAFPGTESPLS